jgi:hypothetical protein
MGKSTKQTIENCNLWLDPLIEVNNGRIVVDHGINMDYYVSSSGKLTVPYWVN